MTHASQHAEQSVLGDLLGRNEIFAEIGPLLQSKHFAVQGHGDIWTVAAGLIAAGKPADCISVAEEMEARGLKAGGYEYLSALSASVYSSRNTKRHAQLVVEKYRARCLAEAADEAREIAAEDGEIGDKIDRITSLFDGLVRSTVTKGPRSIADIAIERIAEYEALADGVKVAGWRTHIPWLTDALTGGFSPGGLYVLAARPSVGKSSFAQDLGMNFAQDGLPTLYLSQEMADTEVADRGVANAGHLSYTALRSGKMDREHWTRATEAMDKLGRLPFFVDDDGGLTLQRIRLKAKSVKGLKVLILDYLQLCDYEAAKGATTNDALAKVSKGLKSMAKELGIAILALSQLNRDVEKRSNKRPNGADLRDSGAIEQDADVILFLWPVREFTSEGRRIVGLGVDKNRQGPRGGQVGLDFFGDTQRWQQSAADISQDAAPGRKGEL